MSAGTDKVLDAFLGGVGAGAGYAVASDLYAGVTGKRGKRNPRSMRLTPTNEWVMRKLFENGARDRISNRLDPSDHRHVSRLVQMGYVALDGDALALTAKGVERIARGNEAIAKRAASGRNPVMAGPLTTEERHDLPASAFGLPAERAYPMPDPSHAANAKARATQQWKAGRLSKRQRDAINRKANLILYGVSSAASGRPRGANPQLIVVDNPSRSPEHDRLRRKIEKRFKRKLTAAEERELDHAIKAAREFHGTGSLEVDFGQAAPGSPSIVGGAGNLTHLDYEVPWPKSKRRGKWTHKAGDHGRTKKKTRPALLGYGPPDKNGVRWPVFVAPAGARPTFKPSHGFMG